MFSIISALSPAAGWAVRGIAAALVVWVSLVVWGNFKEWVAAPYVAAATSELRKNLGDETVRAVTAENKLRDFVAAGAAERERQVKAIKLKEQTYATELTTVKAEAAQLKTTLAGNVDLVGRLPGTAAGGVRTGGTAGDRELERVGRDYAACEANLARAIANTTDASEVANGAIAAIKLLSN
jgi:hypothetical protein